MKMKVLKAGFAGMALSLAFGAEAGVIFQDDFNAETGGVGALNYDNFDKLESQYWLYCVIR